MAADPEASGASSLVASVEKEPIPVSANPRVASEGTREALEEAAASNLRVGEGVVDPQVVGVGQEASGGTAREALEDVEVVAWAASCPWSVAAEGPVVVAAAKNAEKEDAETKKKKKAEKGETKAKKKKKNEEEEEDEDPKERKNRLRREAYRNNPEYRARRLKDARDSYNKTRKVKKVNETSVNANDKSVNANETSHKMFPTTKSQQRRQTESPETDRQKKRRLAKLQLRRQWKMKCWKMKCRKMKCRKMKCWRAKDRGTESWATSCLQMKRQPTKHH